MFNEGIDVPEANILVFLRSTQSRTIFLQQLGRGLRRITGKNFVLVLDFVANCDRLEMVADLWTRVRSIQRAGREQGGTELPTSGILEVDFGILEFTEVAKRVLDIVGAVRDGYTQEAGIQQLQDLTRHLGHTPSISELAAASQAGVCMSPTTFIKLFGSYNKGLEEAGLEPLRAVRFGHTREDGIQQIRALADELGHVPKLREYAQYCRSKRDVMSEATIVRLFGSFNGALREAGLSVNRVSDHYNQNDAIQQLQSLAIELGHRPTASEVTVASREGKCMSFDTISRLFGSFNKGLEAAGFSNTNPRSIQRFRGEQTEEVAIQQLQELARALGRTPGVAEFEAAARDGLCMSRDVLRKIFGNYTAALKAAGLEPNRPYSILKKKGQLE